MPPLLFELMAIKRKNFPIIHPEAREGLAEEDFYAVKEDMNKYLSQLPDEYVVELCNYFASDPFGQEENNPLMRMIEKTRNWELHLESKEISAKCTEPRVAKNGRTYYVPPGTPEDADL